MFTARWIIAGLLLALSAFFILAQWAGIVAATRRRREDPNAGGASFVPLLAGLLGTIGCLIAPHAVVQRCWWVPLVLDPGSGQLFGSLLVAGVRSAIRRFTSPKI